MSFVNLIAGSIIVLLALQVLCLVDVWLGNYNSRVLRFFSSTTVTQYDYTAFTDEENDKIKFWLTIHILSVVFFGVTVFYFFNNTSGILFILGSWLVNSLINKRLNAYVKEDEMDKSRS